MRPGKVAWLLVALAFAGPLAAQSHERRGDEVELPLAVYDKLRDAAREKKGLKPEARKAVPPYSSCRLLRASLEGEPDRGKLAWQAVLDVVSGGDEPPAVPLILGATTLGRSTVEPPTARVESGPDGTRLVVDGGGRWRVTLEGELSGGPAFPLPRLASVPAAFDVSVPEGSVLSLNDGSAVKTARSGGGRLTGRLALARDASPALVVRRQRKAAAGPAVLLGTMMLVARVSEEAVRTEVRLSLTVRSGLLESRTLIFPGGALVSASGPVLVSEPDAAGRLTLRFEPPVPAGENVSVGLTFLQGRAKDAAVLIPVLPGFPVGVEERLEKTLAVVAEGGLVPEVEEEGDFTQRREAPEAAASGEDVVLAFAARVADPRAPRLKLTRLRAVSVASALARVWLTVFVGESGETRTLLVSMVRSRGRSSLTLRVPADARLLAARVDGAPAAVSRTSPERLELPIRAEEGQTRVEVLLGGNVAPPRDGEKLALAVPSPEEPVERAACTVVLPVGLAVKEEGRRLPPLPAPPASRAPVAELSAADRQALELAAAVAASDLAASGEGTWSPDPSLPKAPPAYVTDLSDLADGVPPLSLTLVKRAEKERWY